MKQSGLQNRFSQEVRVFWSDWHACNVCGFNQFDAIHHIVSPSSKHYTKGKHNTSILNSCPIHNYTHPNAQQMKFKGYEGFGVTHSCHVGNEAWLNAHIPELLGATVNALVERGYELKEIDREFLTVYSVLYYEPDWKMLKYK